MWADILVALRSRILAVEPETPVEVGGSAAVPDFRQVTLLRGPGTRPADADMTGQATQTVYVECWEHHKTTAEANARLQALEMAVIGAMTASGPQLLSGWGALVNVENIEPDGDAFRPSVGSRMTVRVNLRKVRDDS